MDRSAVISLLGNDWDAVQALMRSALRSDVGLLDKTNSSILDHSGKQLRPMLCLLAARACGGSCHDSLVFAAAAEMLHNATLLHDDVADSSKERRGLPTAFSLFGPSHAVLIGDFWLARAVELVLSAQRQSKVVKLFSKTLTDLSEGEMLQLEKAYSADTSFEDYYRIIYCKTASLFESACVSGAISADAPQEYVEAARAYANAVGLAFQIKDDILDYNGDESLGKPVGVDLKEGKITLPLLGAMKLAGCDGEIRDLVKAIPDKPENCAAVRDFVLSNGGVEYAIRCLDSYVEKAVEALAVLPPSPEKEALETLARYNSSRTV